VKISIVSGFFLPVPPVQGGAAEKIWFRFAREFAAAGHQVTHFSRTWPGFPETETIDGVRLVRLRGYNHTRRLWQNLLLDFIWGMRIVPKLQSGDIVVCNTVSLPAHLAFTRPSAGRVVAILGRMPKGQGRFYGRVDRLAATSEAVRAKILSENPRLRERTRVFSNPVDWELHHAATKKAPESEPRTIGFVGRLHPEKGIEILIGAAAEMARRTDLPPWRLRLVGPQSVSQGGGGEAYVESLRVLASEAGAAISVEPPIYEAGALAQVYGSLDIFCYPSLAEKGEGLSVAPIEAMASGAVPVVSALECYNDLIRNGSNGRVFDHHATDRTTRLAGILAELLRDSGQRRRVAIQAQADARSFDYPVVAKALLDDFAQLALNHSHGS